jgi:hypothetical protein
MAVWVMIWLSGHAFFSALSPGTHITRHHGPTNKKLRLHLPLSGVEGSRLRVGAETRAIVAQQPFVFDDSFEHEAWHDGSGEPASQPASERGPPAGGGQWRPAAASGAPPSLPAPHRLRCAACCCARVSQCQRTRHLSSRAISLSHCCHAAAAH